MTADWNQYISIGEFLLNTIDESSLNEEMVARCVISRAYYAAYCIVRDAAVRNRIFTITGDAADHKELRKALEKYGYSSIARKLNDLRAKRDLADYDGGGVFKIDDAVYYLKLAKKVCGDSASIC